MSHEYRLPFYMYQKVNVQSDTISDKHKIATAQQILGNIPELCLYPILYPNKKTESRRRGNARNCFENHYDFKNLDL